MFYCLQCLAAIRVGMIGAVGAVSMAVAPALAEVPADYPNRPITIINSQGVGGVSDVFIRVVAERLGAELGQQIVVDNRPGGHSNIGMRACADAEPDGYTFCVLPGLSMTYNPFLFAEVPYDPIEDFEPVTNLFFLTQVFAVNADLGVSTLEELVEYSKTTPLTYTSPGPSFYMYFDRYFAEQGGDVERVPFRGGGEAANDLLSGTTPVALMGLGNVRSHIEAGTVVGLFVDSEERSDVFPDMPTQMEVGIEEEITRGNFGFWAPAGTPQGIVEMISEAIGTIGSDPDFQRANLYDRGLEPAFNTPEEYRQYHLSALERAAREVEEAGIEPQ